MKADPQAAWNAALSADARKGFPADIQSLLEKPVAGRGDWEPYNICFSSLPMSEYREAVFRPNAADESRFFAFPVGSLVEAGTLRGIPLEGFVIDEVGVFKTDAPVAQADTDFQGSDGAHIMWA